MLKKVLVTGGASGIGKGIVLEMVKQGYQVIIVDNKEEPLDYIVEEIKRDFPHSSIQTCCTDLSSQSGLEKVFDSFPQVDILVNNLGFYENVDFFEITQAQWSYMIHMNFMIATQLSQFYLEGMLKRKKGRVIFISSESALNPDSEKIHYCVAKTMLLSLSRNLAQLTKNTQVTVNSILPGPTITEGVETFIKKEFSSDVTEAAEMFMKTRPTSIINRLIDPSEIGNAVVYLSSDLSGAVNGISLRVDGGIVNSII